MLRVAVLSLALASGLPVMQTPLPQAKLAPSALSCADFHHNDDGSWSPTHLLLFGDRAISPANRFQPGMKVFGSDLGATLRARCLRGS